MAKITFSFSNQAGDIPTYEFTKEEIESGESQIIYKQLELSDDKVFVCFPTFKGYGFNHSEDYEKEHPNFFVTSDIDEAEYHFLKYQEDFRDYDSLNYNFFCFPNYEEAFKYCIDLKEGL